MSYVELSNIGKSFDRVEVLKNINLSIKKDEFCVLVGPSGCGKSTLLRIIAGLENPSTGTLHIENNDVTDLRPRDRNIAMVFQNYALYPHLTVAQNMGFSLKLLKKSKVEIERAVKETAEILGIGELLHRLPKQLSGGQRQRVAMGRAIVRQPQVFLFDEPLSNLDAKLRVQMRAELKALHRRLATTTVYVTHDQIEAMTMADFVVVMRDGNVEQVGRPLELYDNPVNQFVAGFIGSPAMNFFSARTEVGYDEMVLSDGQTLLKPTHAALDGSYIIGIRPEHIRLDGDGASFEATIQSSEQTGSETLLQARLADQEITILLRERFDTSLGNAHEFVVDAAAVLVFDTKTGAKIEP